MMMNKRNVRNCRFVVILLIGVFGSVDIVVKLVVKMRSRSYVVFRCRDLLDMLVLVVFNIICFFLILKIIGIFVFWVWMFVCIEMIVIVFMLFFWINCIWVLEVMLILLGCGDCFGVWERDLVVFDDGLI